MLWIGTSKKVCRLCFHGTHCIYVYYRTVVNLLCSFISPQTADSVCCYDYEENLVYAGDSFSGSFSQRVTTNGVPPYNEVKMVPQMSTWLYDTIPWHFCCVWGDLCMYYQEHRPTRDCRWYQPPRMGRWSFRDVCLFVCIFACLLVCCLFVCLYICVFACLLFVCLFVFVLLCLLSLFVCFLVIKSGRSWMVVFHHPYQQQINIPPHTDGCCRFCCCFLLLLPTTTTTTTTTTATTTTTTTTTTTPTTTTTTPTPYYYYYY